MSPIELEVLLLVTLSSLQAQAVAINHKPVGCVVAGKLPRLESGFEPAAAVAQARVYFRAGGTPNWYFVAMTPDGKSFQGVLPKPLKSTKTLEYYIETLDAAVNSSRTSEYSAQVVSDPGACSKKLLVATVAGPRRSRWACPRARPGCRWCLPALPRMGSWRQEQQARRELRAGPAEVLVPARVRAPGAVSAPVRSSWLV